MKIERLTALFGATALDVAADYDLDDEGDRIAFVEHFSQTLPDEPGRESIISMRTVVVTQMLEDTPPETWATFKRLTDLDVAPEAALTELSIVIAQHLSDAIELQEAFDLPAYIESLEGLPLPNSFDLARAIVDVARREPGIEINALEEAVIGIYPSGLREIIADSMDPVVETLIEGPLTLTPNDRTIHVHDLVNGAVFTHRLTEAEIAVGALTVGFDLGPFRRLDIVSLDDGTELEPFSVERHHLAWSGPAGWLDRFEVGDLLACTAEIEDDHDPFGPATATISITIVDDPELDEVLVANMRARYDEAVAEPGLPVGGDDLGWLTLFHHPGVFARPQRPLGELAAAGGLEARTGRVAHDESIWRNELFQQRYHHMASDVPVQAWRHILSRAIHVLDDPDATVDEVRSVLDECAEPETLDVLADVFFDRILDPEDEFERGRADAPGRLFELVDRATTLARKPREIATAQYLAAVLAERCGDPEKAEQHLKRADQAQQRVGPVVERLGWYRFDRGDARGAMRWWRMLAQLPEGAETLEPFLDPKPKADKVGRNDPCWCGSGRKFKKCHQGSSELPALPDRIGWLCRKAIIWLEHGTTDVRTTVIELAGVCATGDPDFLASDLDDDSTLMTAIADAFEEPIVFDAALHEDGLFSLFLRDRGALLPEDEQLLAASWLTIDRSVFEVTEVDPGVGLTVRDLISGETIEVVEQTASKQLEGGELLCARIVPDGVSHQIVGGVFDVRAGEEAAVMELCEEGSAAELCAWVGAIRQPPTITHKPGMAEEMFDLGVMEELLSDLDSDGDPAEVMAALQAEMSRQAMTRWVDEPVPALGGLTPRDAAADPTRREEVERLLAEFDRNSQQTPEGLNAITYDTDAMRKEIGLA